MGACKTVSGVPANDNAGDSAEGARGAVQHAPMAHLTAGLESVKSQLLELTDAVRELAQRLPTFVTVDEAARLFNVTTRTVRRRIRNREWPVVRVGREVRLDLAAIRPGLKRSA